MGKKLAILLLSATCVLSAFSQSNKAKPSSNAQPNQGKVFTIKGLVLDSITSETVPYATMRISLSTAPQKPVKLFACDGDGAFKETLNQAGKYIINIQSVGKATTVRPFTITEGKESLDLGKIYMSDQNKSIGEVTVTAQKPLVKVEIDKIIYSLEDDPEAQTNNTLDMLRKVPMITVDGEDNIQLKGSSNYKIYINGKPSNLLSGGNASDVLKSMPASSVKNIEVITDPGAKYDAEGIGGIINIITTKNALQGYTGSVRANASSLGSFGGGGYISLKAGKLGITANYGYNSRNSPYNDYTSVRLADDLGNEKTSELVEKGRSKNKGPFQYGYLEASYEIDTLNLISVGANIFRGKSKSYSDLSSIKSIYPADAASTPIYQYKRNSFSEGTFGSTDVNVDYQHSTSKKDELLTVSYRFSNSPNDNEGRTELTDVINYYLAKQYPQWNINDASTTEHTAQVDYTNPIIKDHNLEVGIKYIFRDNSSNTLRQAYDSTGGKWNDISTPNSDFRHMQHIYSAYAGYSLKMDKFGAKAGVRAEGTSLKAKYRKDPAENFSTNYFDVVPNITLTYQLSMAQQLRLGYNMRIQRPGIWYLNPYINDTDPQHITQGNPNLDSEKSNNINLNYSMFAQKININASLSYSFNNNSIQQYSYIVGEELPKYEGAMWTTYDNIGKQNQASMFVYGNWNPIPLFRIYMNGGVDYTNINSGDKQLPNGTNQKLKNDGFSGSIYAGTQFNLPKDFVVSLNGGYFSPWIMLQGKRSPYYFAGLSINKSFLKKKLTLSLGANNPFWKTIKMETRTEGDGFSDVTTNFRSARNFRFSISYRFGTLKEQIKKVRRGISNDDQKSGGSSSGGGGEQSM